MSANDPNVLLRVEHLSMYFGKGENVLKAVDDVSFDINKGEVFGLVGESGCGKTTTGRSIIKLYDITSGNVYFKGILIAAGKRSYREAIRAAREEYKASAKTPEDKESWTGSSRKTVKRSASPIRPTRTVTRNTPRRRSRRSRKNTRRCSRPRAMRKRPRSSRNTRRSCTEPDMSASSRRCR